MSGAYVLDIGQSIINVISCNKACTKVTLCMLSVFMSVFGRWKLELIGSGGTRVMLVDETERCLVCERPLQDGVKLSLHHDKEQRHVCILTNTITQYVETKAHLVTIATGVEGQTED